MTLEETIEKAKAAIKEANPLIGFCDMDEVVACAFEKAFLYAAKWHSEHDTGDEYDEYCHAHGVSAKHFLSCIKQLKGEGK